MIYSVVTILYALLAFICCAILVPLGMVLLSMKGNDSSNKEDQ